MGMNAKPPKASGWLPGLAGLLLVPACSDQPEATVQPSTDRLVAQSVRDVRAANAALAAPHAPSKSIAEISRPDSPDRKSAPESAAALAAIDGEAVTG